MTTAPGSSTRPDSRAVKSLMFCMNSGIISIPPIMAMNTSMPSTVPSVNMRLPSTRSSSSGSARRSWRCTNHTSVTTPTPSGTSTCGLIQPTLPALLNPNSSPPKAKVDRISESRSRWGFVCSVTFFSVKYAKASAPSAIGSIITNSTRQDQ